MITFKDIFEESHQLCVGGSGGEVRRRTAATRAYHASLHRLLAAAFLKGHRYDRTYLSVVPDQQLINFLLSQNESHLKGAGRRFGQLRQYYRCAEYYIDLNFSTADLQECMDLAEAVIAAVP